MCHKSGLQTTLKRKRIKIMSYQIVSGNLSLRNAHFFVLTKPIIPAIHNQGSKKIKWYATTMTTKNQDQYKFGRVCFIASVGHIKWMHENHNHLGCMSSWYKIQPLTYTLLIVFNKLQGRQVQSCSKSMSSNLPTKKNTKYFNVSHIQYYIKCKVELKWNNRLHNRTYHLVVAYCVQFK